MEQPDKVSPGEMEEDNKDKVLILDAGAQYGKVIDRRCREAKVHSHVKSIEDINAYQIKVRLIKN